MTSVLNRSSWTALVSGLVGHADIPLEVIDAQVTMDEARAPYIEAVVKVALPASDDAELIDPRTRPRIQITASNTVVGQATQNRTFDLLLHERTADPADATLTLVAVSDEALLIDLARTTPTSDHRSGLDVPTFVAWALSQVGATLTTSTPGTLTSEPTEPTLTNLFTNPSAETNATGMAAGNCTLARNNTWAADGAWSFRVTAPTSADNFLTPTFTLVSGKTYTISATLYLPAPLTGTEDTGNRARRIYVAWSRDGGATFTNAQSEPAPNVAGAHRLSVTFNVPLGVTTQIIRFYHGHSAGTAYWDAISFIEGRVDAALNFTGATPDSSVYDYAWTGTAHASTSTRTWLPNSNAAIIEPGTFFWDWLAPMLTASDLRLFCDEARDWHLVPASNYTLPGVVSVAAGFNAIAADDQVSLRGDYCDSVVCIYRWTDADGASQQRYDVAGAGGRTKVIDYDQAYPGPGAAQGILDRAQGRGRAQTLTALLNLNATPGMALTSTLPGWPSQSGSLAAVTFRWAAEGDSDTMTVRSRGLIDTSPNAWILATGEWDDRPNTTKWNTYPA